MRKIIIDCDIGNGIAGANVDDGLALALALVSPEIEVKAVTTVSGNVLNYKACLVAKRFLQASEYDVPVYCGSFRALKEPTQKWRERLDHGVEKQGLKYLWQNEEEFLRTDADIACNAVDKMAQIINENPHEVTLIAIGPLTNLALLLTKYPEVQDKIQEIVLMGGCFNVKNYLKDTNFGLDPEAAKIVLDSSVPCTMAPFDTTTTTLLRQEDLEEMGTYTNALSEYLYKTTKPWLAYSMKTRGIDGCWIHDVLTVAYLIDSSLFSFEEHFVNIELCGAFRGRTYIADLGYLKNADEIKPHSSRKINIMTAVSNEKLLRLMKERFKANGL